jgi:DNA repair exonuclease SbcCD nuclease subunit
MTISFLHAADIHLDSPLKGLERYENAPVERIRGATRRAFTRLIDLAIDKRVDFVLLAGDLYDGDWRDYNTGLYLVRQLGRLRDERIPVIVIAGNHDASNKMTRILRLPDNVRVLAHDHPETVQVPGLDVAIHGQSFARPAVTENLAVAYPAPVSGFTNIGLLHTGLSGADGHERYAPCTLEDLRLRGYDYWALGHVHTRQVVCNDPPVIFVGNTQGRHIREAGPKGCMIATVCPDGSVSHVFQRLDHVRWERGRVDVGDVETESQVLNRVADIFRGLVVAESDPDGLLAVRVTISGATPLHGRLQSDPERFVAEVRSLATEFDGDQLWIERVEIQTRPPGAWEVPSGPFEELQEVIELLRSDPVSMGPVIEELAELKRKLPADLIREQESPRIDDVTWLQTLLGHVQPLLVDLLLRAENDGAKSQGVK